MLGRLQVRAGRYGEHIEGTHTRRGRAQVGSTEGHGHQKVCGVKAEAWQACRQGRYKAEWGQTH